MRSVQRRFGKFLPRSADESQVAILLKDFDHAIEMFTSLIDSSKAWQQAWRDILAVQERLLTQFTCLYQPILGASSDHTGPTPRETPQNILDRTRKLQNAYQALKVELDVDIRLIESRIIIPATEAKNALKPMKKTIKTREDRKLDFERYQGRRDTLGKKSNRSDRDNVALAKHESDYSRAQQEYDRADNQLRSHLPVLLSAIYSLVPELLNVQINTSYNILAHYYTQVHDFCIAENFPSPPPPMHDVVARWAETCRPVQHNVESSFACVISVKIGKQPAQDVPRPSIHKTASNSSVSPSPSLRSEPSSPYAEERMRRVPSSQFQGAPTLQPPGFDRSTSGSRSTSPSELLTPSTGSRPDYFARDRIPSSLSIAASKKKPPPPPPKKPNSFQSIWVTAQYDFAGQNPGDLDLKEGDRIKVIKKTDSVNDWWEGELNGIIGSFPANYCQT